METKRTTRDMSRLVTERQTGGIVGWWYVLVFNLLTAAIIVKSSNLDTSRVMQMEGPANSSFGYSVALWSSSQGTTSGKSVLVVGSPAFRHHIGVRGAVFICDPQDGNCTPHADNVANTFLDTASQILNDVDESLMDTMTIGFGEHVSATPLSPFLLLCAPRYPFNVTGNIQSSGGCIRMGGSRPTIPLVPVTELYFKRRNESGVYVRQQNSYKFTGFSEVGFSSAVSKDSVYLGGPNAFYAQGAVFFGARNTSDMRPNKVDASDTEDCANDFWDMLIARLDGRKDILVTSAPNALEMKGQIRLYERYRRRIIYKQPRAELFLTGASVGTMYGYSLGAADLDGDSIDDLAVGAPYQRDAQTGSSAGAVYIYYGPLKHTVSRKTVTLVSPGGGGHYGLAVAGAGDLNRDGYSDLAVGAPDDGAGKVFIYNGATQGVQQQPSQILDGAELLLPGLTEGGRFGFSISGGQDLDGNGFPDLLVGAVASSKAIYIRSAPVLRLIGEVMFEPKRVAIGSNQCTLHNADGSDSQHTCFQLKLKLEYNSTVYKDIISVHITIKVDENHRTPRTLFLDNRMNTLNITQNISHLTVPSHQYWQYTVYLVNIPRPSKKELIKASMAVSLVAATGVGPGGPVPPMLDNNTFTLEEPPTARIICNDTRECYAPSDLVLRVDSDEFIIGDNLFILSVNISCSGATGHQVVFTATLPSIFTFSRATSHQEVPHCSSEDVHGSQYTQLTCTVMTPIAKDDSIEFMLYLDYQTTLLLEIVESQQFTNPSLAFQVNSDTPDETPDNNVVSLTLDPLVKRDLKLTGSSTPEQARALKNESLSLSAVLGLRAENNTPTVTALGPAISHTYNLHNFGPSPLLEVQIELLWPMKTLFERQELPVLYITEDLVVSGPVTCEQPSANSLNLTLPPSQAPVPTREDGDTMAEDQPIYADEDYNVIGNGSVDNLNRHRRSTASLQSEAPTVTTKNGEEETVINCQVMTCTPIICTVTGLPAGVTATVTVISRLVLAAAQTKYRFLDVSSEARLMNGDEESFSVNTRVTIIDPPKTALGLLSGNWWLLLVALCAGLLLVLVLVLALYKCGFFKRKKRQRLQHLRASQRETRRRLSSQHQHEGLLPDEPLTKEQEQEHQQNYVFNQMQQTE